MISFAKAMLMRRFVAVLVLVAALLWWPSAPARSYTLEYSTASTQIRWPAATINIALSTSLQTPPVNIKPGSDVAGAVRRALRSWSEVSNVRFNLVTSSEQSISASGQPDGLSLITVADTGINRQAFGSPDMQGRARIFFDPSTGTISEADLALNPTQQFSTDGTPGTFDLESTFVHEIGHMLGLEHSGVVEATMQPRQARNDTYDLPAISTRTLSTDDIAGIRSIYGPLEGLGSIAGTITNPSGAAIFGAHVFAEEVSTGRLIAGNVTLPSGAFRIDALPPGQYRVVVEPLNEPVLASEIATRNGPYLGLQSTPSSFRTFEAGTTGVSANSTSTFNVALPGFQPFVNPRFVGTNAQLSTVAAPLVPGRRETVLVGGNNLHLVNAASISVTSDFISVDRNSLQKLFFTGASGEQVQVLSFDVVVSILAPPGGYNVRLASDAGEVAYVAGGLTVDLPSGTTGQTFNLIDNAQFFVAQHYRDFFNREPDRSGLEFWVRQITDCADEGCREVRRNNVSAAFFLSAEFQETGFLVYRFYHAAFGRRVGNSVPLTLQEFLPDTQRLQRGVVVGVGDWQARLEANKQAYAAEFVSRADFLARYPATLSPEEYIDRLNANTGFALSSDERDALARALRNGTETRAGVLRRVAEDADEQRRELNRAFVLMQYFGYLRRNPSDSPQPGLDFSGYNFWLTKLEAFGGNYLAAEMVKAFLTSGEYRRRFGAV
ncbi:MAG TPA: matrixin family metalloprotease [Pyrinomonadaceae bacterium]